MTNLEIKNNAMDYIRYVSINDNRASGSYQKWLKASEKAPSQGLHLMKMAGVSRVNEIISDLDHDKISLDEYIKKAKAIISNIWRNPLREDTTKMAKAVKEQFPKTYAKRLAIISTCEDDFWGKINLASANKSKKKYYTSLFKVFLK